MSLEIRVSTRERLDALKVRTGEESLTGVLRRALSVYDLLVTHHDRGGQVLLRDAAGTDQRLVLP